MKNKLNIYQFNKAVLVASKIKGLKKTDYKEIGKYPVIDQGQNYISAYSNNSELVENNTPFIVFGDHTRVIKYVDFPAILGNDGVKILRATEGIDNKFLYYQLLSFSIPNTGYNRHYKFLSDKSIQVPQLHIQQKIASILSSVDEAIQKIDQIIQKTEELKRGMMDELLTRGIGHTKFKKTKLGEIPEEWEILTLQEMIDAGIIISHLDGNHGELYPKASEFTEEGIPYISAVNLSNGKVDFNNCKFLPENRARQFKKGVSLDGDVLFAHNATVGPVGYLKTTYPFVILSTSLTYYRCDSSLIVPKYVLYYMQSPQFITQYKKVMSQTTRNQVPITAQRKLYHLLPSKDEQTEIAKILDEIDKKIHLNRRQYSDLVNLKNGLMQDIFNQRVTVN